MKKVAVFIMMVVMTIVMVFNSALADREDDFRNLCNFIEENEMLFGKYYGTTEGNVYYYYGRIDKELCEEIGINGSWDEPLKWFPNWYENVLEAECPEYGDVKIDMCLQDVYNGTNIYRIIIIGENDLFDYEEGDQTRIDVICVFY